MISGASLNGKFVRFDGTTQVCSESDSPVNCSLSAYMPLDVYKNPRTKQLNVSPGCFLKLTGKTVINSEGTNVKIDMFIDTARRIEYPAKKCSGQIKLFDVRSISTGAVMRCSDRMEMMCNYYNKQNSPRYIIVRTGFNDQACLQCNTNYNVSGEFRLRLVQGMIIPVVFADTLVKDIRLDERISIKMSTIPQGLEQ